MNKIWSNIRAFGLQIAVAVNLLTFMGLLFTGYSGYIDPTDMPFAALAGMSYCMWVLLAFVLMVLNVLLWRRLIFIPVAGILLTMGPLLTYSPINFAGSGTDEADSCHTFSVLTYNVCAYSDGSRLGEPVDSNLTVDYIIHSSADVVCVQEGRSLNSPNPWLAVSSEMVDTLNILYPYYESDTTGLAVYSRYPLTNEMLPLGKIGSGSFTKYHLTIHGQPIILYNVHMQTTGLSTDDRMYYMDLTMEPRDARIGQVKQRLIHALYEGYAVRALQARVLAGYVEHDSGTVILCGDFNDVPGCYPLRLLEDAGMKDAFYEAGFGPSITYNLNRLYFRIDHSMYKGDIRPLSVRRIKAGISDHYPLLTEYVIKTSNK